jgi:sugar lactone lactonase YvrE
MKSYAALILALAPAFGATTAYWETNNYQEFLKGKLEGVSLTRDGRLMLAPRTQTLFTGEQPVIWSIAPGPQSSVYLATGHRGQIYRVEGSGNSTLVWTAPEPEVFAIAVDKAGTLYAGTSPDGKIYRISGATASEYFHPKSKYIWSMTFGADGALYAGTGDEGKVFRITAANTGELWYETGQTHVTAMAFDNQQRLLAGTEPNGILYRITAKDKAFVLHDAVMPEIRAIVPAPDGSLYVATLGGAFGKKPAGAQGAISTVGTTPVVSTTTTTITVTDEAAQQGIEIKPKAEAPKPAPAATPAVSAAPMVDYSTGLDKSSILRIHPDNLAETIWVSKEENIYDLVRQGNQILFSTDTQGRIYRLEDDRKATLVVETREGEATRLWPMPDGLIAATSHAAKLLRIAGQIADSGSYESAVHDAGAPARWGRIRWQADNAAGTRLVFRTRSGNSAKPDKTWSDWSAPVEAPDSPVSSPNARYLQWKADFTGAQGRSPQLDSVTVAYLPQNTPPVVKSVTVTSQATAAGPKPASTGQAATAAYSITVSDSGDAPSTSGGTPSQTVSRPSSGQLVVTWSAEDADADKLSYSLYFRGEEEREWKLLKKNLHELAYALDGDALADGRYLFRVVASDAPSNPPDSARESDMVSTPALIDNTPPQVTASALRRQGSTVEIDVDVVDQASVVRRAEASLDAGPWMVLPVSDGVADSLRERFLVRLADVPAGEHIVVIRAYDTAGNSGVVKVVLR